MSEPILKKANPEYLGNPEVYPYLSGKTIKYSRKIPGNPCVAALLCVLAVACRVGITASRTQDAAMKSEEGGNGKISADNEKETDAEHLDERMELAFAYFLELEDYQKVLDTLKPYRTVPQKPKH